MAISEIEVGDEVLATDTETGVTLVFVGELRDYRSRVWDTIFRELKLEDDPPGPGDFGGVREPLVPSGAPPSLAVDLELETREARSRSDVEAEGSSQTSCGVDPTDA